MSTSPVPTPPRSEPRSPQIAPQIDRPQIAPLPIAPLPIAVRDQTPARKADAPVGIGGKFAPDGRALVYRGNTVLCRLAPDHPVYRWIAGFLATLGPSPVGRKLALLPPASLHMTILGIANDAMRTPGPWPADLAPDVSMDACDDHVRRKLAAFPGGGTPGFDMRLGDLLIDSAALSFHLVPQSEHDERRLRRLREDLATHFQVRRANHRDFQFHLGIAYLLDWLTPDDRRELDRLLASALARLAPDATAIRFEAPELCAFETMLAYDTLAALPSGAG